MSTIIEAAYLYLKCLAELSPCDILLSEQIIHALWPPLLPQPPLIHPAGVKTGLAFVFAECVPLPLFPLGSPPGLSRFSSLWTVRTVQREG